MKRKVRTVRIIVGIGLLWGMLAGCASFQRGGSDPGKTVPPGETERIQRALEKVLAEPESADASYQLALAYLEEKRPHRAAEALEEALAIDPQHVEALLQWAQIVQRNQLRILALCEGALQKNPQDPRSHEAYGLVWRVFGQPRKAEAEFLQALKLDPNAIPNYLNLVQCYTEQGRLDKVIETCQQGLQHDPQHPDLHLNLGHGYREQKKWSLALKSYQKAIELAPESANGYFWLGQTYDQMGKKELALPAFQKAVKLNPNHIPACNSLAYLYAEQRINLKEALDLVLRAVQLQPEGAPLRDTLGWVYFQLGDLEMAEKELRTARALAPKEPHIVYHLGMIHRRRGQNPKAREAFQLALKLNPDPALKQAIQRSLKPISGVEARPWIERSEGPEALSTSRPSNTPPAEAEARPWIERSEGLEALSTGRPSN